MRNASDEASTSVRCFNDLIKMQRDYSLEDARLLRQSMGRQKVVEITVASLNRWGGVSEPVAERGCTLLATLCRDAPMLRKMRDSGVADRAQTLMRRHPASAPVQAAASALHAALRGVWQLHECALRVPVPPLTEDEARMWLPHTFGKYVRRSNQEGRAVRDATIENAHDAHLEARINADASAKGSLGPLGRPKAPLLRSTALASEHASPRFAAWRRGALGRSFSQELVTAGDGYSAARGADGKARAGAGGVGAEDGKAPARPDDVIVDVVVEVREPSTGRGAAASGLGPSLPGVLTARSRREDARRSGWFSRRSGGAAVAAAPAGGKPGSAVTVGAAPRGGVLRGGTSYGGPATARRSGRGRASSAAAPAGPSGGSADVGAAAADVATVASPRGSAGGAARGSAAPSRASDAASLASATSHPAVVVSGPRYAVPPLGTGPVAPTRRRFDTELLLLALQHYRGDADALTVLLSPLAAALGQGPGPDEAFGRLRRASTSSGDQHSDGGYEDGLSTGWGDQHSDGGYEDGLSTGWGSAGAPSARQSGLRRAGSGARSGRSGRERGGTGRGEGGRARAPTLGEVARALARGERPPRLGDGDDDGGGDGGAPGRWGDGPRETAGETAGETTGPAGAGRDPSPGGEERHGPGSGPSLGPRRSAAADSLSAPRGPDGAPTFAALPARDLLVDWYVAELPLLCHSLVSPLGRFPGHASLAHTVCRVVAALCRSALLCSELGRQGAVSAVVRAARGFPDPLPRDTQQAAMWALSELCRHGDNVVLLRGGEGAAVLRELSTRGAAEAADAARMARAEAATGKARRVLGAGGGAGAEGAGGVAAAAEAARIAGGAGGLTAAEAAGAGVAAALGAGAAGSVAATAPPAAGAGVRLNARTRDGQTRAVSRRALGARKPGAAAGGGKGDAEGAGDAKEAAGGDGAAPARRPWPLRRGGGSSGKRSAASEARAVAGFLEAGVDPDAGRRREAWEVNAPHHKGVLGLRNVGTHAPGVPTFGPGYFDDEPLPLGMPARPPPLALPLRLRGLLRGWEEEEAGAAEATAVEAAVAAVGRQGGWTERGTTPGTGVGRGGARSRAGSSGWGAGPTAGRQSAAGSGVEGDSDGGGPERGSAGGRPRTALGMTGGRGLSRGGRSVGGDDDGMSAGGLLTARSGGRVGQRGLGLIPALGGEGVGAVSPGGGEAGAVGGVAVSRSVAAKATSRATARARADALEASMRSRGAGGGGPAALYSGASAALREEDEAISGRRR